MIGGGGSPQVCSLLGHVEGESRGWSVIGKDDGRSNGPKSNKGHVMEMCWGPPAELVLERRVVVAEADVLVGGGDEGETLEGTVSHHGVVLLNGGTLNGSGISGKVVGDGKVGIELVEEEGSPKFYTKNASVPRSFSAQAPWSSPPSLLVNQNVEFLI